MHLGEAGMDQQSWGVGQEVDMGTDLPDDTRALLMYRSEERRVGKECVP